MHPEQLACEQPATIQLGERALLQGAGCVGGEDGGEGGGDVRGGALVGGEGNLAPSCGRRCSDMMSPFGSSSRARTATPRSVIDITTRMSMVMRTAMAPTLASATAPARGTITMHAQPITAAETATEVAVRAMDAKVVTSHLK